MSVITERFEVEREVGTGGMGTVFRAIDRDTGAHVALKVLQKQLHSETERFLLEARVLAQLQHPAIVRYIAHGVTTEGAPYIAMEWLEGEDLWARLQQRVFTVEETVLLARRLAEALASAHAQGIVHRDIKPSNIFLEHGEVGRVKLLDFGVARILDLQRQLTMTGTFLGTPAYTAPEQARGERHVGPEADVFSLGCVLFECLTGRGPFDADNVMAVLTRLLMEQPARLRDHRRDIPEAIATLVERMIIKDPKKRPANGAAVLTEICSLTWQNSGGMAGGSPAPAAAAAAAPYSAAAAAAIYAPSSPNVVLPAPEPHSTPAERLARSGFMRRVEEPEQKKAPSPFESQVTHIQQRPPEHTPHHPPGNHPPQRHPAQPPARQGGPVPSRPNPVPSMPQAGPHGPAPHPSGQHATASHAPHPSTPHPSAQQVPAPYAPPPYAPPQQAPSQQAPSPYAPPQQAYPPAQQGSSGVMSSPPTYAPHHPVVAPSPQPSIPPATRPITARYAPPFAQTAPDQSPNLTPSGGSPAGSPGMTAPPVSITVPPGTTMPPAAVTAPSGYAPSAAVTAPTGYAPPAAQNAPSAATYTPPPPAQHAPPAGAYTSPVPSNQRPAVSQAPSTMVPGAPLPLPPAAAAPHAPPAPPAHPAPHGPPSGSFGPPSTSFGPPSTSHDYTGDQSPVTQAVPSRPAPPSSRPGSSQLKRYKLMGFAASLVEHREKPANLSELSDHVYDLLAKYVSMPWAMMQSHCTRLGRDPYNLQREDLAQIAEPLSKAVTPFAGPKGAAVLLQELRALL